MTTFAPKTYQSQVLDSVEAYFKACHELPSPSIAFTATIRMVNWIFDRSSDFWSTAKPPRSSGFT